MTQTLILLAHPTPSRSIVTRALCETLAAQPDVTVRNLYQLYPDFDIDVPAEQQALLQADLVIWLTPVHWYSVPALMKHWFDQVLTHGWAYGHGTQALRGKSAWWVTSAGADASAYRAHGMHGHAFADYAITIERIGDYCGMHSLPHWVMHAGHSATPPEREAAYQTLLVQWRSHVERIRTAATAPSSPSSPSAISSIPSTSTTPSSSRSAA